MLGGYESCRDMKARTGITANGEYPILFAGKNVTIYCHRMDSLTPREYVSLPKGESENYSEIYGLRLIEPRTCPFNGTRNDECECVRDARRREGLTLFSKIRVNVTSLKVNSMSHTYSYKYKNFVGLTPFFGPAVYERRALFLHAVQV